MITLKLLAVFFVLFGFAMSARKKAGGSLDGYEEFAKMVNPRCDETQKERIAREHWRMWGSAAFYVSVVAVACAFVSWVVV